MFAQLVAGLLRATGAAPEISNGKFGTETVEEGRKNRVGMATRHHTASVPKNNCCHQMALPRSTALKVVACFNTPK